MIVMNATVNIIAIAVTVRYPQLREDRTTVSMFLLTASDLVYGCTAMPISAVCCSSRTLILRNWNIYLPKMQAVFSV